MLKSFLEKISLKLNKKKIPKSSHDEEKPTESTGTSLIIVPESYEKSLKIPYRKTSAVVMDTVAVVETTTTYLTTSTSFCSGCITNNGRKVMRRPQYRRTRSTCTSNPKYERLERLQNFPIKGTAIDEQAEHKEGLLPSLFGRRFSRVSRGWSTPCLDQIQLEGPFVHEIAGCSCGECKHEFYTYGQELGYGINIYGQKACMAVPMFCHDFAVIYCV